MQKIVLCADGDSLAHPELLGLDDMNLEAVPWLECVSCGTELRERLKAGMKADEVWIASSDDVDAINLLAALRKDDPGMVLLLVIQQENGSVLSRAQNAGANATLTAKGFAERFALENLRCSRMQEAAQGEVFEGDDLLDVPDLSDALTPAMPKPAKCALRVGRGSGQAFVFTVFSGSGGAGKSTVSAISAALAAERGHKTLLIDCDLQFGDIHRLLGENNPLTLDNVLEDPEKLESLGAEDGACGPFLLAAPKRLEQSEVIGQYLPNILDSASALFDVIVVNTGANWADYHAVLLERSECSLLLVDQRASSVRACQHALELCSRLGVASGAFAYAVNHCERGALFTSLDVAFVMQGAHVFELKEGGPAVEEMLGAGQLDDFMSSKNSLCESVADMLSEILPEKPAKEKKRKRSRRKKQLGGQHPDDHQLGSHHLGGQPDMSVPLGPPMSGSAGNPRKRASRRRGRSAKPEGIPAISPTEEDLYPWFGESEEKVRGSWR